MTGKIPHPNPYKKSPDPFSALFSALTPFPLGFGIARAAGLNHTDSRTVAIEVGMQNGGMATGLAFGVLNSPAAALASAVFGPWSAVTSSVLASWWRRKGPRDGGLGGA